MYEWPYYYYKHVHKHPTHNGTGLPYRSSVCTFTPDPVPDAGLNTALSPVVTKQ